MRDMEKFAKSLWISLFVICSVDAVAQDNSANLIAVGEGVSSPTLTSTINFSSGYTSESPLGVIYQNSIRLTGEYDQNGNEAYGAELGYGGGWWGVAGGYRKRDCEGCEGKGAGAIAVSGMGIGFGIRFEEDIYAAAFIFNPLGTHRVGIMGEFTEGTEDAEDAEITAVGVGYSYVGSQFTFTLDASGKATKDDELRDELLSVTPGLMVRASFLQVSVNDRIRFKDKDDTSSDDDDTEHDFWLGAGIGASWGHVAVYSDYVNELAVAVSLFF
jgi:hypothetical protein